MHRYRLKGGRSCHAATSSTTSQAFERSSKRRKGFPSETRVKRGRRIVRGDKLLEEKLGRNDPCPCGSGKSFQEVLSEQWTLLTVASETTTSGIEIGLGRFCVGVGRAALGCVLGRGKAERLEAGN
jgi:hypothetical protein